MQRLLAIRALSVALPLVVLVCPSSTPSQWLAETVAQGGTFGRTSLALDGVGNAHIAYCDASERVLVYARQMSGRWMRYGVAPVSDCWPVSLTVTAVGYAHIAFLDYPDVCYATNSSGSWATTDIGFAGGGKSMGYPTVTLDPSGVPHVAYANNDTLQYAAFAQGAWAVTPIGSLTAAPSAWGVYIDLSIDSAGRAHITYSDYRPTTRPTLEYVTNASGTWVKMPYITYGLAAGGYQSSAVDSQRNLHSCVMSPSYQLTYSTRNSVGPWTSAAIDNAIGGPMSLAVDAGDKIHVAYQRFAGGVRYATNASGTWTSRALEPGHSHSTSIAVGDTERIHIAYYGYDGKLRHIVKKPRFEQNETAIRYIGRWGRSECEWCSGKTAMIHSGQADRFFLAGLGRNAVPEATADFIGSGIRWIASKAREFGKADVYIDGKRVSTVDLYADEAPRQRVVFASKPLQNGRHTLSIKVLPQKNPMSAGYAVPVDAFEVIP